MPVGQHYSITELESLAVVWAIQHFHAYLHGHDVTVITDHSAVQASQSPMECMQGGGLKCLVVALIS